MAALDPFTLLISGGIFVAATVMILMFSRVGLGEQARGLRTWLIGDILTFLGQVASFSETSGSPGGTTIPIMIGTTGILIASLSFHWLAIRRHVGATMSAPRMATVSVSMGVASAGACWSIDNFLIWSNVFHGMILVMLLLPLPALIGPARRYWGARMLATIFVFGVFGNLAFIVFAAGPAVSLRQELVTGLLATLVLALLSSSALLLWFQEELSGRLMSLAVTDALTGALNRRGLLGQLRRELARAGRTGQPVSIVVCDLDHFKKINDVHGHTAGDTVLKAFVARAQSMLRGADLVGRWGGEEFLFVLPDTALVDAVGVVERLQRAQRPAADTLPLVTFSAGVSATHERPAAYDADDLIALADSRLYIAKETRNRVIGAAASVEEVEAPASQRRDMAVRPISSSAFNAAERSPAGGSLATITTSCLPR